MDDSDEEFQRALALSRQEEEARQRRQPHHSLATNDQGVNDDAQFEDELAKAIALSMQGGTDTTSSERVSSVTSAATTIINAVASSSKSQDPPQPLIQPASQFLLERKKLEQERLARQNSKRPRRRPPAEELETTEEEESDAEPVPKRHKQKDVSPRAGPSSVIGKKADYDDFSSDVEVIPPPPARRRKASPAPGPSRTNDRDGAEGPLYWDGEVRQTANRFATPAKDTKPVFRLSEIIGSKPLDLQFAILASYCNDVQWLRTLFPSDTPVILIGQGQGNPTVSQISSTWIMATPFLRGGRGCMHMKFILLFYEKRLRVVLPTANFVDYDWRDIENTVYVHDVPLLSSPLPNTSKPDDDFPSRFQYALRKLNFAPALTSLLSAHPNLPLRDIKDLARRWDWSRVRSKFKLVLSVPGKFEGKAEVGLSGHLALGRAVKELGVVCPEGKELVIECQGSSIGTYSSTWLTEFYHSVSGKSLSSWYTHKANHPRGSMPHPTGRVRIVFPSLKTVDGSVMGRAGGGTMFCRQKQWEAKTFPRELFYDSKSKRGGILMHSKMVLGLFVDKSSRGDEGGGWCYIGSHNFTPSAWGNLSATAETPVVNVTNFEMGVCFAVDSSDVACWERPPRKYVMARLGVDEPWMQDKWKS